MWLATAAMFGLLAIATVVLSFVPLGWDSTRMLPFAAVLAAVSLLELTHEPQPIGSTNNHLVIASIYVCTGLGVYAYAPHGAAAIAAAMFIGPVTVMRLVDREEIVAHLLAASVALGVPMALGPLDVSGVLGIASVLVAMWVVAGCSVLVFEAAEAQGEELEALVRRDPLTGLGNVRLLSERLDIELGRHGRSRRPLSVLTLDLNDFKALNDTIGHAAGDELLQRVAGALTSVVRPQDTVVRQGGDEFCILLPDTTPAHAERAAAAVRAALAALTADGQPPVSTGIGIASYPRDAVHGKVLLHVADERLMAGKEAWHQQAAARAESADASQIDVHGLESA